MTYYSQCGEDEILYTNFFKDYKIKDTKYFLELGALDGITYSNTKFFEDTLGWKGVLVECNPYIFPKLCFNRPNCSLLNAVVSNSNKPTEFSVCLDVPAVSSVSSTTPENFNDLYYKNSKMIKINTIPVSLTDILEKSGCPRIDLLVLDVEGHEVEVLESFDFKFPVVLWMIEVFSREKEKGEKIANIMKKNNYTYIDRVASNNIYINNEYTHLFIR